jgi:hypothetical protein
VDSMMGQFNPVHIRHIGVTGILKKIMKFYEVKI